MRNFYLLCLASFIYIGTYAQSPQLISFQAQASNADGSFLINQNIAVKISIVEGSLTGTAVYQETHSVTTGQTGVFNLNIGGGTPVMGTFASINWASGNKFVKTEIDPANGTNYTLVSAAQFLSVPFALYAEKAKQTEYDVEQNSFNRKYYPDGFMNGDTLTLTKAVTFTVPSGKTLYVLNWNTNSPMNYSDPETYGHIVINEKDSLYSSYSSYIPMIIPQNSLVRVYGNLTFKAFLVTTSNGIEPVIISRRTTYTVPPNKRLYVYRVAGTMNPPEYGFDTNIGRKCNVKWNVVPYTHSYYDYIPSGTIIETNCSVLNGYLISY